MRERGGRERGEKKYMIKRDETQGYLHISTRRRIMHKWWHKKKIKL